MNYKLFTLLTILTIILLIPAVSAVIPITVNSTGSNFIQWSWSGSSNVNNISIDGLTVCGFDPRSTQFILTDLNPGENHTINVYSNTDSGTLTSSTLPASSTPQGGILDAVYTYMWAIAAIVLLLIGMKWVRIFSLCAWFPSLIGLVLNAGPVESLNFGSIAFWIYIILFVISPILYIAKKTGY